MLLVTWGEIGACDKQEFCLQGKVLMGTSHSWWLFFALLSNADVIPGKPPRAVFVFSWEILQWALGPSFWRHFPGKQVSLLTRAAFLFS